jgi:hypothetical protein
MDTRLDENATATSARPGLVGYTLLDLDGSFHRRLSFIGEGYDTLRWLASGFRVARIFFLFITRAYLDGHIMISLFTCFQWHHREFGLGTAAGGYLSMRCHLLLISFRLFNLPFWSMGIRHRGRGKINSLNKVIINTEGPLCHYQDIPCPDRCVMLNGLPPEFLE